MRHTRSIFGLILLLSVLGLILSTTTRHSSRASEENSSKEKSTSEKSAVPHADLAAIAKNEPAKLSYNRDIRPILAENCFACHGPDSASRQAELRLDQRDAAIKMNAIVPNEPQNSESIKRIFTTDADEVMPPKKSHKKLTQKQKDTLVKWINEGAEYEPHWSYIAPTRPALPKVKNEKWVRNPIDAFILRELEKNGLAPAPEADRRTIARRLSLDLRGLPPEPEEVESFVNDKSADYYEKYVDRLMATPQWGEHRARYWLDYARYADSHGIHFDGEREMWSFRDWLINAMNQNMPFDQFTIETLAGDLLPNRTLDQEVASGFHRCAASSNETGLIEDEYITLYTRDRTETTAQVWMGLTMNCAVCHDHKFDPISQREFYELSAFFNNIKQTGNVGGGRMVPPTILVPKQEDRAEFDAVDEKVKAGRKALSAIEQASGDEFNAWVDNVVADELATKVPTEGLHFSMPLNEGSGNVLHYTQDGTQKEENFEGRFIWEYSSKFPRRAIQLKGERIALDEIGNFEADQPFSYGAWIKTPYRRITASCFARMTEENEHRGWDLWMEGERIAAHLVSHWDDDAIKVMSKGTVPMNRWNHFFVTYDGSKKASGLNIYFNGVLQETEPHVDNLKGSIRTTAPFTVGQRNQSARIDDLSIEDIRLYNRELSGTEVATLANVQQLALRITESKQKPAPESDNLESKPKFSRNGKRSKPELPLNKDPALIQFWLSNYNEAYQKKNAELSELVQLRTQLAARGTIAFVMQEMPSKPAAYILDRGEYDKRKEKVSPGTPASLPPFPSDMPRNRLGLAKWLLMPENPLTARVNVNRFWQEVFGTGIVRTVGDLGVSGELPSHPELLDWLAVEFRESGWDIKRFYKLMVTSAAYRQSSDMTKEMIEKDPQNLLLSRGPRFRMDGEMVRDTMLAASGLLVKKIGGPSVKPYQPDGVWEAVTIPESNTYAYYQDRGEKLYRRSMYTFWKRAAPPASMEIFNGPNRDSCVTRRDRTNTPLQALVTLNDPQMVEAARVLAERTLSDMKKTSTNERIDALAQRLLSRSFTGAEKKVATDSVNELLSFYEKNVDDAKKLITVGDSKPDTKLAPTELAAWTMLVNQLMNLDEVLNK